MELLDRIKNYYFSSKRKEINGLIIATIVFAFILSFDFSRWGQEAASSSGALKNVVSSIIIVAISLAIHDFAIRVYALRKGMQAELQIWWAGLLGSLIATIATAGTLLVFFAGRHWSKPVGALRLGSFRYREELGDHAKIALFGSFSSIFIAGIVALFAGDSAFLSNFVTFNWMFGLYTLFPLPNCDGSIVFFESRGVYISGCVTLIVFFAFMESLKSLPFAIIGSIVAGGIGYITYSYITS